jgi:hypothetical protein
MRDFRRLSNFALRSLASIIFEVSFRNAPSNYRNGTQVSHGMMPSAECIVPYYLLDEFVEPGWQFWPLGPQAPGDVMQRTLEPLQRGGLQIRELMM